VKVQTLKNETDYDVALDKVDQLLDLKVNKNTVVINQMVDIIHEHLIKDNELIQVVPTSQEKMEGFLSMSDDCLKASQLLFEKQLYPSLMNRYAEEFVAEMKTYLIKHNFINK